AGDHVADLAGAGVAEAELAELLPDVVDRLVADPAQHQVLLHGRAGVAAAVVAHDLAEPAELLRGQVAAGDLHLDRGEALLALALHVAGDEAVEGLAVAVRRGGLGARLRRARLLVVLEGEGLDPLGGAFRRLDPAPPE